MHPPLALYTTEQVRALDARVLQALGLSAYELMGRAGVRYAIKNIAGLREPLEGTHPWYVLVETTSGEPGVAEAALERLLAHALEDGLIADAAVAQTAAPRT